MSAEILLNTPYVDQCALCQSLTIFLLEQDDETMDSLYTSL